MIGRLNHVAIAVPDLEAASAVYRDALGARVSEPEDLPEHGVTVVFVTLPNTSIELVGALGTDIVRLQYGNQSSRKSYSSSFIPGLHDLCMILEKDRL